MGIDTNLIEVIYELLVKSIAANKKYLVIKSQEVIFIIGLVLSAM